MRVLPPQHLAALPARLGQSCGLIWVDNFVRWFGPVPSGEEAFAPPLGLTPDQPTPPAHSIDCVVTRDPSPTAEQLATWHDALRPGGILLALDAPLPAAPTRDAGFTLEAPDLARKSSTLPAPAPAAPPVSPPHRAAGYALLAGCGLEIGAFNEPAPLPAGCTVSYFDALDAPSARRLFPEIDPTRFIEVDHVGDLDQGDLARFPAADFDFVVCNHVIEHVANPVRLVRDLFHLVRPGGHVVLTVPDKNYTFDHERPLTTLDHLWADYTAGVTANDDSHYLDFIRHVTPHVLAESTANQARHVELSRERREHAHVWDSTTFAAFLAATFARLNLPTAPRYLSLGRDNRLEYFSVWQKLPPA